ncbi:MAG: two-component system response regulator [Cryomorphaceae bacterium]|nr:response regulator [Flavobacteriales bacterium]
MNTQEKSRILLVDDEVITLRITRRLLTENGYDVDIAKSSSEAMKFLSKKPYQLVIVDITMPSISGFDLIQLMQSFDYDVPVVFLSNNDNEWTIEEAYNVGAKRFVSKEREFNFLADIVKEVLTSVR